jgi:hypothetical protein
MTMHLEGPWLTTTGKKKGPRKWASSEAKAKAEYLAREWRDNERRWAGMAPKFSAKPVEPRRTGILKTSGPKYPPGREPQAVNSLDTGWVACVKTHDKEYTGTKVKGIGTMHKSNAVPIFSDEEAIDISKMRR